MKYPTDKPTVAVRFEGTILKGSWDEGEANDEVIGRLKSQAELIYIVIVTPLTQSLGGYKVVLDFLVRNEVPYDEVWAGNGIPDTDHWWDNNAGSV